MAGKPPHLTHVLTTEERRRGAINSNKKRREQSLSVRQRIANKLDERADEVIQVFIDAMKADVETREGVRPDFAIRLKAAVDALEQAFGKPVQPIEGTGEDGELVLEHRGVSLDDIVRVARETGVKFGDGEG